MKKFSFVAVTGIFLILGIFILSCNNSVSAYVQREIGTYQCAICGVIEHVRTKNTYLNEHGLDGHKHDWRYIGGLSGTIHPIR